MTYMKQINEKIKSEMKLKSPDLNKYRYFKSILIENEKAKKPIKEEDVLRNYKKSIDKSLQQYKSLDLMTEVKLLEEMLPKLMSQEEVQSFVMKEHISIDTKLGPAIGIFNKLLKGKAEPSTVAQVVKSIFDKLEK